MSTTDLDSQSKDNFSIKVYPTKELFITMLVKDITIKDAIGDLVDNSVDAIKKNSGNPLLLEKFEIHIEASQKYFSISDNGGGLEVKDAMESAFCFGKPKNYKQGKHTIGQFGIGMKRAFFKLGNYVDIQSDALTSSFEMHIDVDVWRNEEAWDFEFDKHQENITNPIEQTRTLINVSKLNPDVQDQFNDRQFIIDLKNEIALEHMYSINRGLNIYINNEKLISKNITLIYDDEKGISPAYWEHVFKNKLKAEIVAGISDDINKEGGWYIFCNERLILGPDTSEKTGWTGANGNELPKYHDQYFRFRGYVFFNSEDSSLLPWNTTKNGMNMDSPDFLYVRNQMIIIGKQVKKIMDDMKKERERGNPESKQNLNNVVKKAAVLPVVTVMANKQSLPTVYKYPETIISPAPKTKKGNKITFYKPDHVVQKAKLFFETDDKDVAGELAFDYFYENEIE